MAKLSSKYRKPDEERITPYVYECEKCEKNEELYFKMSDNRPEIYDCPFCGEINSMKRIFNAPIHIPFQWGDTDNKLDFGKSPSKKRHFW